MSEEWKALQQYKKEMETSRRAVTDVILPRVKEMWGLREGLLYSIGYFITKVQLG